MVGRPCVIQPGQSSKLLLAGSVLRVEIPQADPLLHGNQQPEEGNNRVETVDHKVVCNDRGGLSIGHWKNQDADDKLGERGEAASLPNADNGNLSEGVLVSHASDGCA